MRSDGAPVQWNDALLAQAEALCHGWRKECSARGGWLPATAGNFSFRDEATGRISYYSQRDSTKVLMSSRCVCSRWTSDCNAIAGPEGCETVSRDAVFTA